MPVLYGITPEWGIDEQEEGMLVESLSFDFKPEFYEQKDNMGRDCGIRLTNERCEISVSGAIPLGYTPPCEGSPYWRSGHLVTLANVVPDGWAEPPTATTAVITSNKITRSNSDAAKRDVTITVYAFGHEPTCVAS